MYIESERDGTCTRSRKTPSLSLRLSSKTRKQTYVPPPPLSPLNQQDQLTLLLPTPLEAHHSATLRLRFSYGLPDALEGLYRSTWTEEREATEEEKNDDAKSPTLRETSPSVLRAAAVTQFEANSARIAFPCFDEPALRAPFAVSLVTDEGLTAISNMPKVFVEQVAEGDEASSSTARRSRRKKTKKKMSANAPPFPPPPVSSSSSSPRPRRLRHVFEPTPAMPTYLVAVVVGPLGEFFLLSFFRGRQNSQEEKEKRIRSLPSLSLDLEVGKLPKKKTQMNQ